MYCLCYDHIPFSCLSCSLSFILGTFLNHVVILTFSHELEPADWWISEAIFSLGHPQISISLFFSFSLKDSSSFLPVKVMCWVAGDWYQDRERSLRRFQTVVITHSNCVCLPFFVHPLHLLKINLSRDQMYFLDKGEKLTVEGEDQGNEFVYKFSTSPLLPDP